MNYEILKNFIKEIENLVDKKVKIIKSDNGTEFKNKVMDDFCKEKDSLGKFDGKSDEGFFVGYSLSSKAFRVYNTRTRRVEENLHIGFLENKPMIEGNGPKWLFDIDSLTQSMNYVPVTAGTISNDSAGTSEEISQDCIVMPIWKDTSYFDSPTKDVDNGEPKTADDAQKQVEDGPNNENAEQDKFEDDSSTKDVNAFGKHVNTASLDVNTGSLKLNVVGPSVNTASSNEQDSPKDMFTMGVSHTLEATHIEFFSDEDEPEVDLGNITNSYTVPTTPNTRIHKDHLIDNVIGDVWILVDLPNGKKAIGTKWVFRNKKDEWGIVIRNKARLVAQGHRQEEGIKVYVDDIIFGSINKELCTGFEKLMKDKFQMSFIGELTFFLGLQVQQKEDGIFISQDKYVAEILKKFNYTDVKSASTPVDLEKPLVKDGDVDDVDCKKQTVVATSITEAEYVAAASCCRQVLWIQNQLLDYGYNFMNTVINIDNNNLLTKDFDAGRFQYLVTSSSPKCQDTILGDVDTQTRFEITSKQSNDSPLSRGYTLGSGEDSMKLLELMELCTQLSYKNRKSVLVITSVLKLMLLSIQFLLLVYINVAKLMLGLVNAVRHMLMLPVQVPAAEESDWFAEIIDFLKASCVHYTLTVNLIIYTSCIEQFWATAKVQTVNGVRQLQALVDKKRVILTESSIRSDLHLDDAESIDCLPTATICEELARMGYEKPSQKFTFYKAFFSLQWKYFIHTITQCLSDKSTAWNELSCSMASFVFINQQLGDMSTHKKIFVNPFHIKKVFANMKRAGKDYSGRITPLFDTMMVQASEEVGEDSDHLTDSTQIPTIDQPSTSSQPKKKRTSKKTQRKE
ncbi:putative ribonuclease H-like domain-containing protein [Tanacetum coccineum]